MLHQHAFGILGVLLVQRAAACFRPLLRRILRRPLEVGIEDLQVVPLGDLTGVSQPCTNHVARESLLEVGLP